MRKKLTVEELVKRCLEILDEHDFPFRIAFDIPGTKNEAWLYLLAQEGSRFYKREMNCAKLS